MFCPICLNLFDYVLLSVFFISCGNFREAGIFELKPNGSVETPTLKPAQSTTCTAEGIIPSDDSESSYVVCAFEQKIVSCQEGMIFDPVSKSCVLPGCRAALDQELGECGSFDCSDKSFNFCPGSKKFSGKSLNDFRRCVMFSKENVQVCSFTCEGAEKLNGLNKVFSLSQEDCVTPTSDE
jgi:hypothetical protein